MQCTMLFVVTMMHVTCPGGDVGLSPRAPTPAPITRQLTHTAATQFQLVAASQMRLVASQVAAHDWGSPPCPAAHSPSLTPAYPQHLTACTTNSTNNGGGTYIARNPHMMAPTSQFTTCCQHRLLHTDTPRLGRALERAHRLFS